MTRNILLLDLWPIYIIVAVLVRQEFCGWGLSKNRLKGEHNWFEVITMNSLLNVKSIARGYSRSFLHQTFTRMDPKQNCRLYSAKAKTRPENGTYFNIICIKPFNTIYWIFVLFLKFILDAIVFQTSFGNLLAVEHLHYPQIHEFESNFDLTMPKVEVSGRFGLAK
jgi:hypothetical protein